MITSPKNIIFDLGGVLIEWDPQTVIQGFADNPTMQQRIMEGIFAHPDWIERDRGRLSEEEAIGRFAARTGLTPDEVSALLTSVRDSLRVKEETLVLMDDLSSQGLNLYCLSNIPPDHYDYLVQVYDFWDKFEGIVVSGHIGMVKPGMEIFQYLLDRYGLDASTCLFIDDSQANIEAAHTLGIRGIRFTDARSCRQQLEMSLRG